VHPDKSSVQLLYPFGQIPHISIEAIISIQTFYIYFSLITLKIHYLVNVQSVFHPSSTEHKARAFFNPTDSRHKHPHKVRFTHRFIHLIARLHFIHFPAHPQCYHHEVYLPVFSSKQSGNLPASVYYDQIEHPRCLHVPLKHIHRLKVCCLIFHSKFCLGIVYISPDHFHTIRISTIHSYLCHSALPSTFHCL